MNIQERIKAPDHPVWKRIGNWAAIIGAPAGTLLILIFVPAPYKEPAVATWAAIMAALKAGTKLTTQ